MALDAGKLRHRVTIQQKTEGRDAVTGAVTETWVDLYTDIPASIEPMSVKEFIQSGGQQSGINTRIVIRYIAGLDATMRIVHNEAIYNPAGFLPDPESGVAYLTVPCSSGVNNG